MKYTSLSEGNLQKFLEKYVGMLKNAKVIPETRLFDVEPAWEKLREGRCIICGNKLRYIDKSKVMMCFGKKHGDRKPFIIKTSKFNEVVNISQRMDEKRTR